VTTEVPPETGSADPGAELREAAAIVRQRYKEGSPAHGFWRVTAGVWERWAERLELGTELSPVAHAEFQAALFSARKYMEMRHGGSELVRADGPLACAECGHVFVATTDGEIRATELSGRLLGHVCSGSAVPAD
jgi:hypothetical protein